MAEKVLHIISHTHWDREWYQDFQNYRYRLVRMMDDLIEHLETREDYLCFHMDGQTIVLADYLEIRPENEERLRKLIKDKKILIGPWYVMPDEFLISGESLVKNLQIGHKICEKYDTEAMKCGYVTDIFGHNSQFPQILNGFGIDTAVLYRGIADYKKDAFIWEGADKSQVTAAKLDRERSYSNFYFAVRWPFEDKEFDETDAVRRMKELIDFSKELSATDAILMMDGVDHVDMEPEISNIISVLQKNIPEVDFRHSTVEEYFKTLKKQKDQLETIKGPLYNLAERGVNNQLLKNVLSSMVTNKQENDRCEILLEKFAEPLNAFQILLKDRFNPCGKNDYDASPRRTFLDKAWDFTIQNHAHDSICGCSKTEVIEDVTWRFRQSLQISSLLTEDAMQAFARNIKTDKTGKSGNIMIFNPSQNELSKTVLLTLPLSHGCQNLRFYDSDGKEFPVQILDRKLIQKPNHSLRKLITFDSIEELSCAAELTVPPCSYVTVSYDSLNNIPPQNTYGYVEFHEPEHLIGSLKTGHNTFDNGLFVLSVTKTGTLNLQNKKTGKIYSDLLLFEDSGDHGDGWNYRKPLHDSRIYLDDGNFTVSIESDGPMACMLKIKRILKLPVMGDGYRRSEKTEDMAITTYVTIVKDSPVINFRSKLTNTQSEHRLRVLFPTGIKSDKFSTKTPYDMCTWNVKADDYTNRFEEETFVHPSQGITYIADSNDSAALYSKGLYEVEVTDNDERALALTLFRAPMYETGTFDPDITRLFRSLEFEYAFSIASQNETGAMREGEQWRAGHKSLEFTPREDGALPPALSFIEDTSQTSVRSFVRAGDENSIELRYFDVSGKGESFDIKLPSEISDASYIDFLGNTVLPANFSKNVITAKVKPNQIISLKVSLKR